MWCHQRSSWGAGNKINSFQIRNQKALLTHFGSAPPKGQRFGLSYRPGKLKQQIGPLSYTTQHCHKQVLIYICFVISFENFQKKGTLSQGCILYNFCM